MALTSHHMTPVVVAERIELAELMGKLTMMERALIRPVTPWISICRLPLVKTIAETLPRRVADSDVTLLVGPAGLDDVPWFERTLVLLFRHNAYMRYFYPEGVILAAMGDLSADGAPAGLTLLQEERFKTAPRPGE